MRTSPTWRSPNENACAARKIVRGNLHRWEPTAGRKRSSIPVVRRFVNERPPNRKVTTATTRPSCRSRGRMNVERRTCHSSSPPRLKPNRTDDPRPPRPHGDSPVTSLPFVHKYSSSIQWRSCLRQRKNSFSAPCFPPVTRDIEHNFVSNFMSITFKTVFGAKRVKIHRENGVSLRRATLRFPEPGKCRVTPRQYE